LNCKLTENSRSRQLKRSKIKLIRYSTDFISTVRTEKLQIEMQTWFIVLVNEKCRKRNDLFLAASNCKSTEKFIIPHAPTINNSKD
jgi:hypothetical protein